MADDVALNTSVQNTQAATQNTETELSEVKGKDVQKRSYSDISKKIAKGFGIALLVVAALVATAILITALLPYMLPAGVAIGTAFQAAGMAVGVFAAKAVTWITAHSTIMIIASSSVLGAAAIGAVAACVAQKCKKDKKAEVSVSEGSSKSSAQDPANNQNPPVVNQQQLPLTGSQTNIQLPPQQPLQQPLSASQLNSPQLPQQQQNLTASLTQEQIQAEMEKLMRLQQLQQMQQNLSSSSVTTTNPNLISVGGPI